jgi:hypothetical protein
MTLEELLDDIYLQGQFAANEMNAGRFPEVPFAQFKSEILRRFKDFRYCECENPYWNAPLTWCSGCKGVRKNVS